MFGSKKQQQSPDPGLGRLHKEITRDRLRLQQRLELVDIETAAQEAGPGATSGRLYQVFVAMGEA